MLALGHASPPATPMPQEPTLDVPPLGDLEVAVLDQVWATPGMTVKTVHERIGVSRGISLNTVQSALDRLYRKGLLDRRKQGHAYCYEALVSREALVGSLISHVLGRFNSDGVVAAAAFAAAVDDLDEAALCELEAELARRRSRGSRP